MSDPTHVHLSAADVADAAVGWTETLRVPSLSMGLYVLAAGMSDPQQPHREDEVYVVLEGRAALDVDGDVRPVTAGTVVYVAAGVPHRFVEIEETLRVAVVFAPPETSPTTTPGDTA